jgi:hypothetical protein
MLLWLSSIGWGLLLLYLLHWRDEHSWRRPLNVPITDWQWDRLRSAAAPRPPRPVGQELVDIEVPPPRSAIILRLRPEKKPGQVVPFRTRLKPRREPGTWYQSRRRR